jgi:DNA-binding response OmpR family regulator
MRYPKANRVMIPRPIVWIVDAHRSDYDHLLADEKSGQLELHFLSSGRELLHCWFAGAPDVCIINLQLREFSGFEVVEMIRPFPERTIVCMLTDEYAPEDEIRALSLGVHSYLCKPLEAEMFFAFCLCPRQSARRPDKGSPRLLSIYC